MLNTPIWFHPNVTLDLKYKANIIAFLNNIVKKKINDVLLNGEQTWYSGSISFGLSWHSGLYSVYIINTGNKYLKKKKKNFKLVNKKPSSILPLPNNFFKIQPPIIFNIQQP